MDLNNSQEHEYVDLGLPSGTLWATCNVGASNPEDYGDHFAWGETKTKSVYDWDTYKHAKGFDKLTKYCDKSKDGYKGFADTLTELQPIDDPAMANWGNGWYTPKKEQWDELMAHTNREWTTRNGVEGWLFTSRRNGKSLFLPAAGYRGNSSLNDAGSHGYYWSSSLYTDSPSGAWFFYFNFNSGCHDMDYYGRIFGRSVRPVRSAQLDMNCCPEQEFVDLGLPSGTLWATCNVGASKPEDYGDYFAWGETKKKDVYDWDTYKHAKGAIDKLYCDESDYGYIATEDKWSVIRRFTKYCNDSDYGYNGFADTLTELQPIDDPATANWGNGWHTPKKEQWDELMAHTNREWATRNGVKGWLFISRRNGKRLFLPAAGSRWDDESGGAGGAGLYWSSSLDTSYPDIVWGFFFDSLSADVYFGYDRYNGRSVRAVRTAQLDMNCCPEHEHVDLGLPSGTLWATCNVGANKPEDNCCPKHEYVDLGLPSGTLWATCNVGANKPEDNGDYFAWDECKTAAANWGNGWDMPSKEQWEELKENTKSIWTTRNGVNGRLFTASNGNNLFLPAVGYRWFGGLGDAGRHGHYWSSSVRTFSPYRAWCFNFNSGYAYVYDRRRSRGLSVRAVRSSRQN